MSLLSSKIPSWKVLFEYPLINRSLYFLKYSLCALNHRSFRLTGNLWTQPPTSKNPFRASKMASLIVRQPCDSEDAS